MDMWSWLKCFCALYAVVAIVTMVINYRWLTGPIRALDKAGCSPSYPYSLYLWAFCMALLFGIAWPAVLPKMLLSWIVFRLELRDMRKRLAVAEALARTASERPPGVQVHLSRTPPAVQVHHSRTPPTEMPCDPPAPTAPESTSPRP